MKKKTNILIIILIIILLAVAFAYIGAQNKEKENRNYEIAHIAECKYFVSKASEESKYGVIDATGKVIIPEQYIEIKIPNPSKDIFICSDGEKNKVFNSSNQQIYADLDEIDALRLKNVSTNLVYEKSVLKYEQNNKYGLINLEGKKLTEAVYDSIDTIQYKEGELLVEKDGKFGVVNQNGYQLVNIEYDEIEADTYYNETEQYYYDGYIVANKTEEGYRYGYVSYEGKKIVEPIYNDLRRISNLGDKKEAYLLVAENGRYGILKNNKTIIANEYQLISYDNNHEIFTVQKGKKYGVMNINGEQVLPCDFEQIDIQGKYLYAKKSEELTEVYNEKGNKVEIDSSTVVVEIPEENDYTIQISEKEDKTVYQICKNNKPVNDELYYYIEHLIQDLFITAKDGQNLGIIDINGNSKTEFNYSDIQLISNTQIIQTIAEDGKTVELLDNKANKIAELENGNVKNIGEYILFFNEQEKIYITLEGKKVSHIEAYSENTLYATKQDDKWGFSDKSGNVKVNAIYEDVTEFNKYGFAGIKQNNKWGVINSKGEVIVEPKYELNINSDIDFIGEYYQVKYGSGQVYYTK